MRLVLIADTFPPLRTSGAVQIRDLVREAVGQGHAVTVLLPRADTKAPWDVQNFDGAVVVWLKSPRTKDVNHIVRVFSELAMPFLMLRNLRKSSIALDQWEGVIWYSPSIFHGPLVNAIRKASSCRSYLIIRDIFPQWALDMGLLKRGLSFRFLNAVARYQYSVANVIGVQSRGNLSYFSNINTQASGQKLEVLQNWLGDAAPRPCSIRIIETPIAERKVFVYAGNIGVAQGLSHIIDLAERFMIREDVGFLFVGRGSEARNLQNQAVRRNISNIIFHDEVDPDEIPDLYAQCVAGIVALDVRHKSHNVPGKFLTYMQGGLPVLAKLNPGNDLSSVIREANVGRVCETDSVDELDYAASSLLEMIARDAHVGSRCRSLFRERYSAKTAVDQITAALNPNFA